MKNMTLQISLSLSSSSLHRKLSSLTGDAGSEVGPTRHLSNGLPLKLLHPLGLPIRGLVSVPQLSHHFGSALDVLKKRGEESVL